MDDRTYAQKVKKVVHQEIKAGLAAAPEFKMPSVKTDWERRKNEFVASMTSKAVIDATKMSAAELAALSKR
jgi:hypothetical protein